MSSCVSRLSLLVLLLTVLSLASGSKLSFGKVVVQRPRGHGIEARLAVRGGTNDDMDHCEDGQISDIDESNVPATLKSIVSRVGKLLEKAIIITSRALSRSIKAGLEVPKGDSDEESTMISKIIDTMQRMWRAALDASETDDEVVAEKVTTKPKKPVLPVAPESLEQKEADESISDFGKVLCKQYAVIDTRAVNVTPMLGGAIGDALREARAKARLLVAFIPASSPPAKGQTSPDQIAIRSLLSAEVSKIAEKRSRKSADTGSFVLWGANAGSPEAVSAVKRLKAQLPKGKKRPTLIVAYPAQVLSPSGVLKLVPKLLAQHHCSPPPSSDAMSAWLAAIRKRHSKQFAAMLRDLKEAQLYRERQEGYISSIQEDLQRKAAEEKAEAERAAEVEAEQARIEAIEERRVELNNSLPEEADKDARETITIALRFPDGRAGQRRFDDSTPLKTILNWVDAVFGLERENISLTTMNGQKSFCWNDVGSTTLKEAGLGRMTGFRVMVNDPRPVVEIEENRHSKLMEGTV